MLLLRVLANFFNFCYCVCPQSSSKFGPNIIFWPNPVTLAEPLHVCWHSSRFNSSKSDWRQLWVGQKNLTKKFTKLVNQKMFNYVVNFLKTLNCLIITSLFWMLCLYLIRIDKISKYFLLFSCKGPNYSFIFSEWSIFLFCY